MSIKKVTAVYFSPTGNTKRYSTELAKLLDCDFSEIDLTIPETREDRYQFGKEDLVILGVPVYAGRVPQVASSALEKIKGNGALATYLVTYGNREFEDSLLELKDICERNGFRGIAAGAFVGPHSYVPDKVGAGRPNAADLNIVSKFGEKIKAIVEDSGALDRELLVSGNHPYKRGKEATYGPEADESCNRCGLCVSVCPVNAIEKSSPDRTNVELCIDCFACVQACPQKSRGIQSENLDMIIGRLISGCTGYQKSPVLFTV